MIKYNDELIDRVLSWSENSSLDFKRVGDNANKVKTISAFANTEGGLLFLGIEDENKAKGRDRVYGVQENPESVDELKRLIGYRITPTLAPPHCSVPPFLEIGCALRNGSRGSVVVVKVEKSNSVHSIVDGGTFKRESKSNRQLNASKITEFSRIVSRWKVREFFLGMSLQKISA